MTIILQLGALQEAAALRGDDRAAVVLRDAVELLVHDAGLAKSLAVRREKDRDRKRKPSTDSAESTESAEAPKVSPDPFLTPKTEESRDTAREDREYAERVERLFALLTSRVDESLWPDIDGFVRRREYLTWAAWLKEMLTILTGASATDADVAQVCRDDEALERRIGSPKGLRTFVTSAVEERRTAASGGVTAVHGRRAGGGVAQRTFDTGRRALEGM